MLWSRVLVVAEGHSAASHIKSLPVCLFKRLFLNSSGSYACIYVSALAPVVRK